MECRLPSVRTLSQHEKDTTTISYDAPILASQGCPVFGSVGLFDGFEMQSKPLLSQVEILECSAHVAKVAEVVSAERMGGCRIEEVFFCQKFNHQYTTTIPFPTPHA